MIFLKRCMVCNIITSVIISCFSVAWLSACKYLPIYFSSSSTISNNLPSSMGSGYRVLLPAFHYKVLIPDGMATNAENWTFECCVCKYIHTFYCSAYKTSASPPSFQCPAVLNSKQNKNANVASVVHLYLHVCRAGSWWQNLAGWVWTKLSRVVNTCGFQWTSYLC